VTESALSDGRAEVTVVLHTTKALSWVVKLQGDLARDPLDFGYRPGELLADKARALHPALGVSDLKVIFTNTALGAPLPDLVDAFILGNAAPGQVLSTLAFQATADGPLRAPFGVAEGTPGQATVKQNGLHLDHPPSDAWDGFPVERVELRVTSSGATTQAVAEADTDASGSGKPRKRKRSRNRYHRRHHK
jgi:hypothetical protein